MNKKDILLGFTVSDLQLFILLKGAICATSGKADLAHNYWPLLFVMTSSLSLHLSELAETDSAHLYKSDHVTKSKFKVGE